MYAVLQHWLLQENKGWLLYAVLQGNCDMSSGEFKKVLDAIEALQRTMDDVLKRVKRVETMLIRPQQ